MKKSILGVLVLGLSVVLTACGGTTPGGEQPEGGVTGIAITPHEVTLDEGGSIRLSYTLTPSGASGAVVWATSDSTIATVTTAGYVEALGTGEVKISATCGSVSDTCTVTIKTYMENLQFTGAVVWGVDTLGVDGGQVHEIESSDGTKYRVYSALATLYVMSDGFYVNNSGYIDGGEKGAIITLKAPMYYGSAYLNGGRGVVFSLGQWGVMDAEEGAHHVATPGSVDEAAYVKTMQGFVDAYNSGSSTSAYVQAAAKAFSGTMLRIYEYTVDETTGEGGYSYSYIPDGIITEGLISTNQNYDASEYMMGLDYSVFVDKPIATDATYTWGLNLLFSADGSQISLGDNQLHYGNTITHQYGELPAEAVKGLTPCYAPVLTIDYPEVAARLQKQLDNFSLRKK